MGILEEIQNGLVEEHPIGPLLLKLRLLSARLGSDALEKWVTHEAEGYPQTADLPEYRVLGVSFSGHFNGPFGSSISNAPIPPHLIGKLAGKHWEHFRLRDSAASIDEMARSGDGLHLDFSNLILAVQGKIYGKYACNSIAGFVSRVALVEAANAIRGRLLQLTIEIERKIPKAKGLKCHGYRRVPNRQTKLYTRRFTELRTLEQGQSSLSISRMLAKATNHR